MPHLLDCFKFCEQCSNLSDPLFPCLLPEKGTVGDLYFISNFCLLNPVPNQGGRPYFHGTHEAFVRLNDLSMAVLLEGNERGRSGT